MCQKGDSPALNAGQVFELVQSTSLQRQPPPVFTYKNYENHEDFVIFRKPAIARPFFLFFNIISKKSVFITICASQIVCRSYDRYTDYGEVRKFRHFPKACHRPNVFPFL